MTNQHPYRNSSSVPPNDPPGPELQTFSETLHDITVSFYSIGQEHLGDRLICAGDAPEPRESGYIEIFRSCPYIPNGPDRLREFLRISHGSGYVEISDSILVPWHNVGIVRVINRTPRQVKFDYIFRK